MKRYTDWRRSELPPIGAQVVKGDRRGRVVAHGITLFPGRVYYTPMPERSAYDETRGWFVFVHWHYNGPVVLPSAPYTGDPRKYHGYEDVEGYWPDTLRILSVPDPDDLLPLDE